MIEEVIFKLERIIERFVVLNNINDIYDILLIKRTNDIVFNNCNYKYNLKYKNKYNINKVDSLVNEFFKSINYDLYLYYNLRKKDGTIKLDYHPKANVSARSLYDYEHHKRKIYIPVSNTLEDAFCIVHELVHDSNIDTTCKSITRSIFTESLSILIELLFEDYLKQYKIKDYKIANNLNLNYIDIKSLYIDFNLKLIETYINKNNINFQDLSNIVINYNKSQRYELNYIIDKILEEDNIDIDYEHRYILGILIASYMYERIKNNKNNILELLELNEMLKVYDVEQVFDYLEIEYDEFDLLEESYKKLEKSYCKYVKNR